MKTVIIKMADPMPKGCCQPEPVTIEISGSISDGTKPIEKIEDVKRYFDIEASKLFHALIDTLPQGVIEPLIIKLLQRRVSLYHGVQE